MRIAFRVCRLWVWLQALNRRAALCKVRALTSIAFLPFRALLHSTTKSFVRSRPSIQDLVALQRRRLLQRCSLHLVAKMSGWTGTAPQQTNLCFIMQPVPPRIMWTRLQIFNRGTSLCRVNIRHAVGCDRGGDSTALLPLRAHPHYINEEFGRSWPCIRELTALQ